MSWIVSRLREWRRALARLSSPRGRGSGESEEPRPAEGARALPGRGKTILVVDDEETVRDVTRHILESGGYRVLEAANGDDALRLCRSHRGPIDLVLTDVVMPGMRGQEFILQLGFSHPTVPILYMSGYPREEIPHRDERTPFIGKPFSAGDLHAAIADILHLD